MSIADAAIVEGRLVAQSLMTLTLTAYSPNGTTTDANGYQVPAFELVPFTDEVDGTPGKVQAGAQAGSDAATRYINIGGVERPVLSAGLHIPISAPVPVASEQRGQGWEYVVTAIGATDDPALLNRRYLVVSSPAKSKATARRLDVVQI